MRLIKRVLYRVIERILLRWYDSVIIPGPWDVATKRCTVYWEGSSYRWWIDVSQPWGSRVRRSDNAFKEGWS